MIRVNYNKKNNYPHEKKIILFDRDAFQSLGDKALLMVNKKYNVLCPQVFVTECLSPNRASKQEKEWLIRRLKLITNPIVFTGDTHISPIIDIPYGVEYSSILTAEEIARKCITSTPITMQRVDPDKLISHYMPRISQFKNDVEKLTKRCDNLKGNLTSKQLILHVQNLSKEKHNYIPSNSAVKRAMKRNKHFNVTDKLNYVAEATLTAMKDEPIRDNLDYLSIWLNLIDKDIEKLHSQIQEGKSLTVENYPQLSYPIYIYYLLRFIVHARQFNTDHLDDSYVRDFMYLHYLNFCDRFITNETSTPHIVNSFPYDDIKNTPISTVTELKSELS